MAHLTLEIKELLADLVFQGSWAGSLLHSLHLGAIAAARFRRNIATQVKVLTSQKFLGTVK